MNSDSSIILWIQAARPKTLAACAIPVLVGGVLAAKDGLFSGPLFIAILVAALLIQITTNFANDYFDVKKGADTEKRLGPLRALQSGEVSERQMLLATMLTGVSALLVGIYLVTVGGVPILVIGILSLLFAILYTGGPFPLAYIGLGDVFVFIFFGPVAVGGTYFLFTEMVDIAALAVGCALGMISTAILVVNNIRDRETDRVANKNTLIVRFGAQFGRIEYLVLLIVPALIAVSLSFGAGNMSYIAAAYLLFALVPIRNVLHSNDGAVLNRTLGQTGGLLIVYGVLFSVGWML